MSKLRQFDLIFDHKAESPKVRVASANAYIKYNEVIRVIETGELKKELQLIKDVLLGKAAPYSDSKAIELLGLIIKEMES